MDELKKLEAANRCKCGEVILLMRDRWSGEWLCMGSLSTDEASHSVSLCFPRVSLRRVWA